MKNNMIASLILVGFISLIVACGNDKESEPQSAKELLVGKWVLVSFKRNGVEELPDCGRDNSITFRQDNTFTSDPGTDICNLSNFQDQPQTNGQWDLRNNDTTLVIIESQSSEGLANILELNSNRLRFSVQFPGYTAEFTYNRS
jgi:hypothetical protein